MSNFFQKLKNTFKIQSESDSSKSDKNIPHKTLKSRESRRIMTSKLNSVLDRTNLKEHNVEQKIDGLSKDELEKELEAVENDLKEKISEVGKLEQMVKDKQAKEAENKLVFDAQVIELEKLLADLKLELTNEKSKTDHSIAAIHQENTEIQAAIKKHTLETTAKITENKEKIVLLQTEALSHQHGSEEAKKESMKYLKDKEEREKRNEACRLDLEKANDLLELQNKQVKDQITTFEESLAKVKLESDLAENNFRVEKEKVSTSVHYLEKDVTQRKIEFENLEKKKEEVNTKIAACNQEIKDLEAEIASVRLKKDEMSKKLESKKELGLVDKLIQRIEVNDETLTEIDLSGQKISDQDCAKLIIALKRNSIVVKLVLKHNPIGGETFLDDIVSLLKQNTPLEYLSFEGCPISRKVIDAILKIVPLNKELTDLFLGTNETDDDIDIFDPIMQKNFNTKYPDE
jgi:hypothetical protein